MSLQVWLPLNGNLNNQGLSNAEIIATGATVNTSGKIGSCYSFDGSDDLISVNCSDLYKTFSGGSQQFSVAFWVYHADSTRAIIFGDYSLTGTIGFNIELTTGHQVRFYWNGSPDKSFAAVVAASDWTHIVLTYNGNKLNIYKNGILQSDSWSGTLAIKNKTSGLFYLGRDSRTGTTVLNGRLNDFRIYDHCLSTKEVEEISKGLILHYKLDDIYSESTTNLFKANPCRGGSRWSSFGNGVKIDWTSNAGDTYWYLDLANGVSLIQDATYTFSCKCLGIEENTIMFRWCNLAGYEIYLHNGWNQYTFSMPSTNITNPFFDDINRDTSLSNLRIYDFQLEEKDHATGYTSSSRIATTTIYDCSGYKRDGTITGSLKILPSSPRYYSCTQFPDSACAITIGNLSTMVPEGNFTFNIWFKKITGEWSSKGYETILGGPSGFELEAKSGGTNSPVLKAYSWGGGAYTYTLDEWHMLTMVRTTTDTKFYMDGILVISGSAGSIPSGNYFIGAWSNTGGQNYRGYFSDARIYSTVLTVDQIKELYNTSMTVDSNGNIYAREVSEL